MILGEKTKSFDTETEVYERTEISHITEEKIKDNVKGFLGEYTASTSDVFCS